MVAARALRGFADGLVSVLLAGYLSRLGFSPFEIGAVVTATLIGSAALTLGVGLLGGHLEARPLLLRASGLMVATGIAFFVTDAFWPLLVVAAVGTMNPSGGDVSLFLPIEQAALAEEVADHERPQLYAVYNLAGATFAAFGALASAGPELVRDRLGWSLLDAERLGFVVYAIAGLSVGLVYSRTKTHAASTADAASRPRSRRPLERSRRVVTELAALFSLDSAGSGFAVQSMLVLWLDLRFDLDAGTTAAVFFTASLLAGCSHLVAGRLAVRIGLVETMVWTHVPANTFLVLAALVPSPRAAIVLLLLRALLSQMDVPARQSLVMAVVPPEERSAAAAVTNVPRSLASATTPLLAGYLLTKTTFGWPLVIGGAMKLAYDFTLLALYRGVPAEVGMQRRSRTSDTNGG